jgi:hypothetical protein
MKDTGKHRLLVAGIICQILLTVTLVFLGLRWGCERVDNVLGGIDADQSRNFKSLRTGMRMADVFARMGRLPLWTNSEFTLGQYLGNEKEYAKTNGTRAQVFYTWGNGDLFYCLGFDTNGLLVVKGKGGT